MTYILYSNDYLFNWNLVAHGDSLDELKELAEEKDIFPTLVGVEFHEGKSVNDLEKVSDNPELFDIKELWSASVCTSQGITEYIWRRVR